jgi:ABC-2 type transport system permease protein
MLRSTPSTFRGILTIAKRDARDILRDRFVLWAVLALGLAAIVSLVTGAIALNGDAATYAAARDQLLALGKSAAEIAPPEFYPLKLLRGTIEEIEIMGAVIALIAGYRAAATERGRQTLALILTRPLPHWAYRAAKLLGGVALAAGSLAMVFLVIAGLTPMVSGIGLTLDDLLRLALVWGASVLYLCALYTIGFGLSLWAKTPVNGLIMAFTIWILVVLVAPQIGDTMDPDNQVAGGVFAQLSIPKVEQDRIKAGFAGYELFRNGIETASVTKHFERFTFAILGIKDSYTGVSMVGVLAEKSGDLIFLFLFASGLGGIVLLRSINPDRLTKEI